MDITLNVIVQAPSFEDVKNGEDIIVTPEMNQRHVMNAANDMLGKLGWSRYGMTMNHLRWCARRVVELQSVIQ